jgi:muramoyltetrapeptide carboxypeptidase
VPRLIKPRAIAKGACIGIAAPGGPVDADKLAQGEALLRGAGFETRRRGDLLARHGYLAGDDRRRAAELMELVTDPHIDAILCARGGYGCDRILDSLDASAFRTARKPLVGYSDITALLLWQRRCAGLVGFHGPMLEHGSALSPASFDALVAALTGMAPAPTLLAGVGRASGRAEGRLIGGNLVLVTASLGTPWELETRGAILLFEEVGEQPYRIDRMLQQLRNAGKLRGVVGVGVGGLSGCVDARYPEASAEAVVEEAVRPLGIPLVMRLPFGHAPVNHTWPMGARASIDGIRGEIRIAEHGVVRSR